MEQTFLDDFQEDFNFYNEKCIEENLDNDEISGEEEGFMMGYLR